MLVEQPNPALTSALRQFFVVQPLYCPLLFSSRPLTFSHDSTYLRTDCKQILNVMWYSEQLINIWIEVFGMSWEEGSVSFDADFRSTKITELTLCIGMGSHHNMNLAFTPPKTKEFRFSKRWFHSRNNRHEYSWIITKTRKVEWEDPRSVSVCETGRGFPTMMSRILISIHCFERNENLRNFPNRLSSR